MVLVLTADVLALGRSLKGCLMSACSRLPTSCVTSTTSEWYVAKVKRCLLPIKVSNLVLLELCRAAPTRILLHMVVNTLCARRVVGFRPNIRKSGITRLLSLPNVGHPR